MENFTKNIENMETEKKENDQYGCRDQVMLQALKRQSLSQGDLNNNENAIDIISQKKQNFIESLQDLIKQIKELQNNKKENMKLSENLKNKKNQGKNSNNKLSNNLCLENNILKQKLQVLEKQTKYTDKLDQKEKNIIGSINAMFRQMNQNNLTLFEFCLFEKSFDNIIKQCYSYLKQTYKTDKYFEYCQKGNIEAVYFCITEGINPEQIDKANGDRSAFMYACTKNYKFLLMMLLDIFKVRIDQRNSWNGHTGFIYACKGNHPEILNILISRYPDIVDQRSDDGWTGFMYACKHKNISMIQQFIDKYPKIINQKDYRGWTGFMTACYNNNLPIIQLLIQRYPKIVRQKNDDGKNGYDMLLTSTKRQIIEFINLKKLNVDLPKILL